MNKLSKDDQQVHWVALVFVVFFLLMARLSLSTARYELQMERAAAVDRVNFWTAVSDQSTIPPTNPPWWHEIAQDVSNALAQPATREALRAQAHHEALCSLNNLRIGYVVTVEPHAQNPTAFVGKHAAWLLHDSGGSYYFPPGFYRDLRQHLETGTVDKQSPAVPRNWRHFLWQLFGSLFCWSAVGYIVLSFASGVPSSCCGCHHRATPSDQPEPPPTTWTTQACLVIIMPLFMAIYGACVLPGALYRLIRGAVRKWHGDDQWQTFGP